ncbi:hypothetical protein HX866_27080 [Pseudomonas gingeri]|uniref:hypothetical protein n=1 Tax=Pseudomonas gingeri TaxID=117681 RepID=UPI00159FEC3E|nr:hypothetical protein [Pseudomonas gingeri]NWA28558.1 hypothetical protein [Pseudomonas gingeri]
MSRSMTLYNALSVISVPPDKARAVVEAWETEMKTVASKSDLIRVEKQLVQKTIDLGRELRGSIKEISDTVKTHTVQINTLSQAIVTQGTELRAEMKEQGNEFRLAMERQGNSFSLAMEKQSSEFRLAMEKQGGELRLAIEKQGNELKKSISDLTADVDKKMTVTCWKFGIIFAFIVIPLGKFAFDYVVKEWTF